MEFKKHKINWTGEKSARVWDYYSTNEHYRNTFFGKQVGHLVARFINKELNFSKLTNVLDFSCGMGDVIDKIIPFLNDNQKIYATDFSQKNIDFVTSRFKGISKLGSIELLRELPSKLPSDFFDLILITEVVEHLNDEELDSTLNEAHRLLKKGGYIFITTPNNEIYEAGELLCPDCGCIYHKWQHVRTWSKQSLENKMTQFNFKTFLSKELNWMNFKSKILAFIKPRPKGGLVYIGKKD